MINEPFSKINHFRSYIIKNSHLQSKVITGHGLLIKNNSVSIFHLTFTDYFLCNTNESKNND